MEEIYHVVNKSIAGFKIFNSDSEFSRMIDTICYYQKEHPQVKFSKFIKENPRGKNHESLEREKLVEIVAYCIMPTHLHLLLKQLKENGISIFTGNVLNSYTRYFNIKHRRKGPLWEGRSKKILVETEEQLLHLTRYIHLNPVTAYLVGKPEEWLASSYREYLLCIHEEDKICNYKDMLDISPSYYRKFVEEGIFYQKELANIKKLIYEP